MRYFLRNIFTLRLTGSQTYMFLFISCLGHSIPTLVFTWHTSVLMMCVNAFIFGFFVGTFHTSANVLLLDIWRGRKSSPYMYTLHLFFGFGSFITPILTKSFQANHDDETERLFMIPKNQSMVEQRFHLKDDILMFWTVDTLYLIIGGLLGVTSFGFLYYALVDKKYEKKKIVEEEEILHKLLTIGEENSDHEEIVYTTTDFCFLTSRQRTLLISLMTIFNFFFAGLEGSFKNFIPAFGSSCALHLTRQDGSSLSAIFFGTYTVNRVFLIVGSMFASPTSDMWISLFLCFISCGVLHGWGETSQLGLQIGEFLFRLCN